jgi:phospholipid-binding lipoprotein MlaA
MNRGTFAFNQFFDKYLLAPLAKGYRFVLPGEVRTGVRNFFSNLKEPWTTINSALQGDFKNTGNSLVRFCLNTTVGLLGIFDVASSVGFEKQKEDFGQTLAVYGLDSGPYLVLPFLGPSTVRDAVGKVAGIVGDPITLALNREGKDDWLWIGTVVKGIDFREQNLEKIDNLEATSVDFYATIRSLYLERRNRMIRNQSADKQDPFKDFDLDLPLINDFE